MPTSDHILSFLLAALLHAVGLLLIGGLSLRAAHTAESAPELEVRAVELTLAEVEPMDNSGPPDASAEVLPAENPLRPLELPETQAAVPPPLALPDKPAFTDALTPPPEPIPEPMPAVPAAPPSPPAPKPSERKAPAAVPEPKAATAAPGPAVIRPAAGGSSGRIDGHPSLERPIKPSYPIGARRRGEEGTVILDVTVAPDGSAKAVARVSSSGFPELDAAAERAAARARFKPGTRDGQPIECTARITIIFRLRDA